MPRRSTIVYCVLTLLLLGYACFALPATARMAAADTYAGCIINVADSARTGFVSADEVSAEIGGLAGRITACRVGELSLDSIEAILRACDKIERVNVCRLANAKLRIDVEPMVPVARVFDEGTSYYINAGGKRISADPRYHIDVPVVVGHFTDERPATRLLPLLEHIAADPRLDALVSTVRQERDGDIIIVPTIRGHVVNFGDTAAAADKFERLLTFYRRVMPVRGWETYDTVAVKWRRQVVATRRDKALGESLLGARAEEYDDIDDHDTMLSPLHTAPDSLKHIKS